MARGGRRAGNPGRAYSNRSDLNEVRVLPVTAAPNQPYGAAGQQRAAQAAVPMASGPAAPPVPTPPGVGGAPAFALPPPGGLPPLTRPSERPAEPVTAGAPIGAGPGPEALGLNPPATPQTLGDLLGRLAQSNPDAAYLQAATANGFR